MLLTVRQVRKAIESLPDDAPIHLKWKDGPPADHEPGVEIFDFEARLDSESTPGLVIHVGLFYLEDDDSK